MGFRSFTDRNGHAWEIRTRSASEWEFSPGRGNPHAAVFVAAPGYEKDPFELSVEELQRLLDAAPRPQKREKKSPFQD